MVAKNKRIMNFMLIFYLILYQINCNYKIKQFRNIYQNMATIAEVNHFIIQKSLKILLN